MKSETDVFSKITSLFLALLLTVFLFSFGPDGYLNILAVKRAVFYLLCGGYCAVMLGLLICRRGAGERRSGVHAAQIFAVLYLLFTLIATLVSPYRAQAWLGASRGEGTTFFPIMPSSFFSSSKGSAPPLVNQYNKIPIAQTSTLYV